jgi:hypothetical protein
MRTLRIATSHRRGGGRTGTSGSSARDVDTETHRYLLALVYLFLGRSVDVHARLLPVLLLRARSEESAGSAPGFRSGCRNWRLAPGSVHWLVAGALGFAVAEPA